MSGETVDAITYLTVEGTRRRYSDKAVCAAKVARVTQNPPSRLEKDQIAVRVTIRLPAAAFDPLKPEALVVIPEELIQHPVEVEAKERNPA